MKRIVEYLTDWSFHYVKSRDAFEKKIVNIEKKDLMVIVTYKDNVRTFISAPIFGELMFDFNEDDHISLITLNTVENLNSMIAMWEKLKKYKHLNVIFVNPLSKRDIKWIIKPRLHSKIADDDSFKLGLKSMFECVDPLEENKIDMILDA